MEIVKTIPKIDVASAPGLEEEIRHLLDAGVTELTIDMEKTCYISSVGLRVILSVQKQLNAVKGRLVVCHVGPQIRELFDVTGFSGFLNLED